LARYLALFPSYNFANTRWQQDNLRRGVTVERYNSNFQLFFPQRNKNSFYSTLEDSVIYNQRALIEIYVLKYKGERTWDLSRKTKRAIDALYNALLVDRKYILIHPLKGIIQVPQIVSKVTKTYTELITTAFADLLASNVDWESKVSEGGRRASVKPVFSQLFAIKHRVEENNNMMLKMTHLRMGETVAKTYGVSPHSAGSDMMKQIGGFLGHTGNNSLQQLDLDKIQTLELCDSEATTPCEKCNRLILKLTPGICVSLCSSSTDTTRCKRNRITTTNKTDQDLRCRWHINSQTGSNFKILEEVLTNEHAELDWLKGKNTRWYTSKFGISHNDVEKLQKKLNVSFSNKRPREDESRKMVLRKSKK
jgi:hypothetical protein